MSAANSDKKTDDGSRKPQTRPKPAPRSSVPPRHAGPAFGRPSAGSPAHHRKRSQARHGSQPTGSVSAATLAPGEGELLLYGSIGQDFWGEGISSQGFNEALSSLGKVSTIHLRVNSGGGDVFEATAIYNMLVKHEAKVVVSIEGVAASAATLISMAGDEIKISENAHFMIHAASGIAWGNAEQLRQYLKLLDNADELIRLTYSRRTGIPTNKLIGMMDHDNWMTAQEALKLGFVDSIDEAKSVAPHVTPEPTDDASDSAVAITPERIAAMSEALLSLAASVGPLRIAANATQPGGSPQSVSHSIKEEPEMKPKMRAKCIACGMPESLTGTAAEDWLEANFDKVMAHKDEPTPSATPVALTAEAIAGAVAGAIDTAIEAREKRNAEAAAAFKKEVDAVIQLAFGDNAPATLANECYGLQAAGVDAMRDRVLAAKKKHEADVAEGISISFTPNQPRDRHLAAIKAGVLVRSLSNFAAPAPKLVQDANGRWEYRVASTAEILERHLPAASRPKDFETFSMMPLIKIAEQCLLADGFTQQQLLRLQPFEVAMAAMGYGNRAGIRASAGLHTTGSMLEVTRDAVNKSLQAGYEEAPQTWRGPFRQGTSVADFKDIHRVKLGAAPNLPVWNDGMAPEQAKLANEKEKYAVEARAETLSFSWRLLVNDDLDAISRHPQLLGDAAGRTVNAEAWRQITANPTMADGVALFSAASGARKRSNLTTGAATPTNATIGAMKALMRKMRGLNTPEGDEGPDILNLIPTFIAGPSDLEEVIIKQVYSGADPAAGGNSGVYNSARTLQPIIEPLLDAASATAWYLFASPNRIDTVEVTFLQGQETPYAHEWMNDETMSQNYSIMQTFGAKAIDHRGMQKHNGA